MDRLTLEGNFCDIAMCSEAVCPCGGSCTQKKVWKRLKQYEDTGLEPEQVLELKSFTQGGIHKVDDGWKHVQDLLQAEQDGRMVVLPCAIGSEVFTIEESYFDCENCEHGSKAKYNPQINRRCCEMDDGEHCPYHIEGHIVEGFTIGADDEGKPSISAPGEWGCEGLETFSGIGGKWYPTREEAEAAMAPKGGTHETDTV